ncbi:DUF262 domain-containing protein [Salipiger mucosus]|uniref:DUF262 domain-containing protein n=1 Tax=Salipiger mucosus DSM 16094 TaxID=1123237 RepID=S9QWQ4_9RHOB|nr:DUF262 domain-containing protein [Salipiger mucosus]EPX84012.1 hypothetical protein Salmuc_01787 [Salipiger mucosus DSM 16094]
MSLDTELEQMSLAGRISTETMSVGELISLFRDGDLALPAGWQNRYRWSLIRKSALIESLFLGITISDVYLAANDTDQIEIVDGVARVATILEFAGVLPDGQGGTAPPLGLVGTRHLPALEGLVWNSDNPDANVLPPAMRVQFRRPKLTVHVLDELASPEQRVRFQGLLINI